MIGRRISHYEIVEKLGEGGMGVVYRGVDTRLGRPVALKFLSSALSFDERARKRLMQEARAASSIDHPNICAVHDVGETDDGEVFIVMPCYEGSTVEGLLSDGPLQIKHAMEIVVRALTGLQVAHEKAIIHRDIKPSNLFVTRDGQVKVMDFGLAKYSTPDRLTRTGTTVGTMSYMSPEQARGEELDARTDLFSMGIVLYEMLSGRLPFPGEHSAAILYAIVHDEPRPLGPEIPPSLARVVMRALRKDRAERYASADEFISDLKAVAAGSSPGSYVRLPVPKWSRVLAVTLPALLILGGWYAKHEGWISGAHPVSAAGPALAVMPFVNESGSADAEHIGDGLAEGIIGTIAQYPGVRVIGSYTSFRYKGKEVDPVAVSRELGVDAVLVGRVKTSASGLRVTVEALHNDGTRLWAEVYNRDVVGVQDIQNNVVSSVLHALHVSLSKDLVRRAEARSTASSEAYEAYLRGRHYLREKHADGLIEAQKLFQQSINADPMFAQAYVALAETYQDQASVVISPAEAWPKTVAAATRALDIDPDLGEPHAMLALYTASYQFNLDKETDDEFKLALAGSPGSALTHQAYGLYLMYVGRAAEARAHMGAATSLEPLSPYMAASASWTYANAPPAERDLDAALAHAEAAIRVDREFYFSYAFRAEVHELRGEYDLAVKDMEYVIAKAGEVPTGLALLSYAQALAGRHDDAAATLERALHPAGEGYASPYTLGLAYLALHEPDKAFEYFERAFTERDEHLLLVCVDPRVDSLRSDPRLKDIVRRMHFPNASS